MSNNDNDDDFMVNDDFDVGVDDVDSDPVEYIDRPVKKISPLTYGVVGLLLVGASGAGYVFLKKPELIQTLLNGSGAPSQDVAQVPATTDVLTPELQPASSAPEAPPAQPAEEDYVQALEALKSIAASLPPDTVEAEKPTDIVSSENALPQPAPEENKAQAADADKLLATQAATDVSSASPEQTAANEKKQEIVRPKPKKEGQPELEFFEAGSGGTIGPGSAFWDAENNPASRPSFENQIIVSSKLTKDRQESKLTAARNAFRAGRYETALRFYDELHEMNKKDRAVLAGRALTLQKMGRVDEAAKTYDDLLSIDPDNKQAIVNMLGIVRQNYPAVAAERLRSLYVRYPDAPEIIAQLGVAQGELGNYEEALQYLSRASSIDPSNPLHYFNMAVIAEHMKKSDLAIRYYQQSLEIDGASGSGKVNREMIYDRLSRLRR